MGKTERQERYKATGGAADLVKVETLVPPAYRERLLNLAASFRNEHRQRKEEISAIVARVEKACETQPRRYAQPLDIDRIVVASVNVPFPKTIDVKTLVRSLQTNTLPKGYEGHFERLLGEVSLTDVLRLCDRHDVKPTTLARFVKTHGKKLALKRPELEEYLHGVVPGF